MLKISHLYTSLSRIAVVITSSPKKPLHSLKPLLDVIISDVFSCIAAINVKNRLDHHHSGIKFLTPHQRHANLRSKFRLLKTLQIIS